jgi:hypothetical protein
MSWDAAFVGQIRIDPARFAELWDGPCPSEAVDGLRALSGAEVAAGTFAEVAKTLAEGDGLLSLDRAPRKGTVSLLGAVDEDTFRARLPALTQLFARAALLGAEGELVLFGLESDGDLAHELVLADGRAAIRPLAAKGRSRLAPLRRKVGAKLAARLPALVEAVPEGEPVALHPGWATRPMFSELDVAYTASASRSRLELEVRTAASHDGGAVALAVRAFEDEVNAGLYGEAGRAKVVEMPAEGRRASRFRAAIEVNAVEPLALRVLVEALARHLDEARQAPTALVLRNGDDARDVDAARMRAWLADPSAFPRGLATLDVDVEDLAAPAKGAVLRFDTDLAPHAEPLLVLQYAVASALRASPDPHGATRKALVSPVFAFVDIPRARKARPSGVELVFAEWSADRALSRGLLLAAVRRTNRKGRVVRGLALALPG